MERPLFGPFGAVAGEDELRQLQDAYSDYLFPAVPHNRTALNQTTYLVVGRRGAGKTTLLYYFKYQKNFSHYILIADPRNDVVEPLMGIENVFGKSDAIAIENLSRMWEHAIWTVVFSQLRQQHAKIAAACHLTSGTAATVARHTLQLLKERFLTPAGRGTDPVGELQKYLGSIIFEAARAEVLKTASSHPILVGIDCLEQHSKDDTSLLWSISGLIRASARINNNYAEKGIHVKTVLPGEIFTYLMENYVLNTAKEVRHPLHLAWTPGDLIRLAMYRYYKHLERAGAPAVTRPRVQRAKVRRRGSVIDHQAPIEIDWRSVSDVKRKLWDRYGVNTITNSNGQEEHALQYILRHTHLRPRQIVMIFNEISAQSVRLGANWNFRSDAIVEAISRVEPELVLELFNSYSRRYPKAGTYLQGISGMSIKASGREIMQRLKGTEFSDDWTAELAKEALVEMGILGTIRRTADAANMILADFQYANVNRDVVIQPNLQFTVHPLFLRRFGIQNPDKYMVYPVGGTE